MINKLGILLFVFFSFQFSYGQNSQSCSDFLKFWVYDKYQTFTSELQYKQVKDFFKSFQFSSRQQAETKANEIGLNIVDILKLDFSGKSSSSNFEQWQQELLKSSYQEALNIGLKIEMVEKISDNITKIIQACLGQKGVHAYIIPSGDKRNFSFTIDYIPHSSSKPSTKGKFTVTPSSVAATGMPRGLIGNDIEIGPQGISITLSRLPSETVTITYNTDEGTGTLHYDAFVIPKPVTNFKVRDESIQYGQSTQLTWHVDNAERVELDGVQVEEQGSKIVFPEKTKEYRLVVISLDGQRLNYTTNVSVAPPPPKLSSARISFRTTDDDKDDDTNVIINVLNGGNTVASVSNNFGKFDDHTESGWKDLKIIEQIRKDALIGSSSIQLIEGPNSSDEWHFDWSLELSFSDGTVKQYDFCCGNVDGDRATITKPL